MVFHINSGSSLKRRDTGFTLIELMVVMAIVAMIITIVMPRYFDGLKRSKEAVLREDLSVIRKAIDDYHADKSTYPNNLEDLVLDRYLKFIPEDPITSSTETWELVRLTDQGGRIYDIHSGSIEVARDGTTYNGW